MTNEVNRELAGTWILESSENVHAYLTELGVGDCERRALADDAGRQTINVSDDDVIHLEMHYGKRHISLAFRLNEEFEIDAGRPSRAVARWKNGALSITIRRVECGRIQVIERKRYGDKMIQTMTSNGVTCRRIMRRMKTETNWPDIQNGVR